MCVFVVLWVGGGQGLDVAVAHKFGNNSLNAVFVDGAQRMRTHFKRYPLARFGNEEFLLLQVWVELAARFAVGVRNRIAGDNHLAG